MKPSIVVYILAYIAAQCVAEPGQTTISTATEIPYTSTCTSTPTDNVCTVTQTFTTPCPATPSPKVTKIVGPLVNGTSFGNPSIIRYSNRWYVFASTQADSLQCNNKPACINAPACSTSGNCGPQAPYAVTNDSNLLGGTSNWGIRNTYPVNGQHDYQNFLMQNGMVYDSLPRKSSADNGLGAWTNQDVPALTNPAVIQLSNGNFVMYYSAIARDNYAWVNPNLNGNSIIVGAKRRCIGIAFASNASFPIFSNALSEAFWCADGLGIEGLDAVFGNGKRWLIFKNQSCPGDNDNCIPKINILNIDKDSGLLASQPQQCPLTVVPAGQPGEEGPSTAQMCDATWLLVHEIGQYQCSYQMMFARSPTCHINSGLYKDYYDLSSQKQPKAILIDNGQAFYDTISQSLARIYTPGSSDWIGLGNTQFIFTGRSCGYRSGSDDSLKLYYGEMAYCGANDCSSLSTSDPCQGVVNCNSVPKCAANCSGIS